MAKFETIRTLIARSGEGAASALHGLATAIYRKTRVGPVVTEVKRRYIAEGQVSAVKFYRKETGLSLHDALEDVKRMAAKNGWEHETHKLT